jgi:hypothetical protein
LAPLEQVERRFLKVEMVEVPRFLQLPLLVGVVAEVISRFKQVKMAVAVVVAVLYLELVELVTRQPLLLMEAMERHLIHNKEEVVVVVLVALVQQILPLVVAGVQMLLQEREVLVLLRQLLLVVTAAMARPLLFLDHPQLTQVGAVERVEVTVLLVQGAQVVVEMLISVIQALQHQEPQTLAAAVAVRVQYHKQAQQAALALSSSSTQSHRLLRLM